jgi:hypothetical protein
MMLKGLSDYYKNNSKNMKDIEVKKTLIEIKAIENELQKILKLRGVM